MIQEKADVVGIPLALGCDGREAPHALAGKSLHAHFVAQAH